MLAKKSNNKYNIYDCKKNDRILSGLYYILLIKSFIYTIFWRFIWRTIYSASVKAIDKATKNIKSFIESIVDAESFVETDVFLTGKGFDDASEALGEGVVTGYATLKGNPVHIFAQNADVLKGSLSEAHANKINKCMQRAIKAGTPLISIIDSCGARVGEGASVMEDMHSLSQAV